MSDNLASIITCREESGNESLSRRGLIPIINVMARRVYVQTVQAGETVLSETEAHHVRDVLRIKTGETVEVFDHAGRLADATVEQVGRNEVRLRVEAADITAEPRDPAGPAIVIASAVPKAGRADWMVEKLSEFGAAGFVPLSTARSVVKPSGENKPDRWRRIATESAKQSRRSGIMRIDVLMTVPEALAQATGAGAAAVWMTPAHEAEPLAEVLDRCAVESLTRVTIFIGPEGGWDGNEAAEFSRRGATAARFGETILRTETAAMAAAAWIALRRFKSLG
jgi:16S rRNA (uracil1498-N3)-methyltransferase